MKNTLKKIMTTAMLLSFAITTPLSSLAMATNEDLLAYGMDYMPEIRGSQPTVINFDAQQKITDKDIQISLSLRDSDVKQVLRMFADKAGRNIIFKGDITGSVTMDLVNTPLNGAFNLVMATQNLTYSIENNTLIITSTSDLAPNVGKHEMATIPVKYVSAGMVAHFLNKNIFGLKKSGLSSSYIAVNNPATNEVLIFGTENDVAVARAVIAKLDKKPAITTFKVNHTTPKEMADMICNLLMLGTGNIVPSGYDTDTGGAAPISQKLSDLYTSSALEGVMTGAAGESSSSSSSSSSGISLGTGTMACSLGITNSAKNESSSSGSSDDSELELVSFGTVGLSVAYFTQLGTISITGATPHQIDMIREYIAKNDRRQPQAYIEVSIIELNESGIREFDNQWAFISKYITITSQTDTGFSRTTKVSDYTFGGHRETVNEKRGKNYYVGTPQLMYALSMIMKNGKGRTISNPRVLATNGQASTIDLSEDYVKSVDEEVANTGTLYATVTRTYEIASDLGLKITVTPFISPDGYVYMNIKPDYSVIKEKNETYTLLARNNLELKNIRLKDSETLVIGGMMRESETKSVGKIPFFGDIPGLGTFFRSSRTEKEKKELIILITPKILTDTDEPTATL